MERFANKLFAQLRTHGYQARIISIDHLPTLQKAIAEFSSQGFFDNEFYQERLSWFQFQPPESLPKAQSIVIIAVPRPQTQAIFTFNGIRKPLIIPPTYTAYDIIQEHIEDVLAGILNREKYALARSALPLKLLAVRSGLGQYGRNNICYVSGMGSFLQLVAIYSDMPFEEDEWQEVKMMKSCEECELCRRACPSDAIPSDRFLLRAERCIAYHNEKKGDIPFPNWMNDSWHNCVVGCMHCQSACPQNRIVIKWIGEKEEFSKEETVLLLNGVTRDRLPARTLRKLEHLNLIDYLDNLPRNLGVFFNKPSSTGQKI